MIKTRRILCPFSFHSATKFFPVEKQHTKYIECSLRKIDDSPKGNSIPQNRLTLRQRIALYSPIFPICYIHKKKLLSYVSS